MTTEPLSWADLAATVGAPVVERNLADLAADLAAGATTSQALVGAYLARIRALDHAGPALRSVVEINPEAEALAAERDAERAVGRVRGLLHGVPVLLKENIDTADALRTTAGSLALLGSRPAQDATVAARLRAAGAVILGKTNLSEWANFRSTTSASGWSGRGGQTRNPHALDRSPGGSSAGSGVAVAASLAAAAIGTETDGSIVCPAALNGVVGLKPTLGLVSRAGVIPIAHSQDTVGPLARSVRDAALLLGVLAGPDPRDSATADAARHASADYTAFLDADGLRGARIGVARQGFFGHHPGADRLVEAAVATMRAAGAIIVDPADVPTIETIDRSDGELTVLLYEFKADLEAYLAARLPDPDDPPRTLAAIIAFNEAHAAQEMPHFGQELLHMAAAKGPLTEQAYRDALATNRRLGGAEGLDAILDREGLDVLVAPSYTPAWLIDPLVGEHAPGGATTPAALVGYPLLTLPVGRYHGLPVGLTFMGRAWSEPTLLRLADALERNLPARTPPAYRLTAE